ncbi:2,5-diamino-6-(ribosylamino)-4(3H)-pyrimidinone 5'-phosphate reductase [Kappamyces sp. JEL0829]|nr:2,5-diamino-6-(ribosylamino)-4(3H)-pyrimidinone 5'-phosphate reductase [Kappamyces sp. JEL0829]
MSKNTTGFSSLIFCATFMNKIEPVLAKINPKHTTNRPFTILTFAQSLDGFIALQNQQVLLSGPESLLLTHSIRNMAEGIMVGIGTVLVDSPSLSTRYIDGTRRDPRPIIVDPRLECPTEAKFIQRQPILLYADEFQQDSRFLSRADLLTRAGAMLLPLPTVAKSDAGDSGKSRTKLDLLEGLAQLRRLGIKSIMVEGGAGIIQEFLTHPGLEIDATPSWPPP